MLSYFSFVSAIPGLDRPDSEDLNVVFPLDKYYAAASSPQFAGAGKLIKSVKTIAVCDYNYGDGGPRTLARESGVNAGDNEFSFTGAAYNIKKSKVCGVGQNKYQSMTMIYLRSGTTQDTAEMQCSVIENGNLQVTIDNCIPLDAGLKCPVYLEKGCDDK